MRSWAQDMHEGTRSPGREYEGMYLQNKRGRLAQSKRASKRARAQAINQSSDLKSERCSEAMNRRYLRQSASMGALQREGARAGYHEIMAS